MNFKKISKELAKKIEKFKLKMHHQYEKSLPLEQDLLHPCRELEVDIGSIGLFVQYCALIAAA